MSYYIATGHNNYRPWNTLQTLFIWLHHGQILINLNKDLDGDGVNDNGFPQEKIDTTGDGQFDTMRYYWRNISESQ